MVENVKRALGERIAMENGFTHLGILPTAGNAVTSAVSARFAIKENAVSTVIRSSISKD